MSSVTNRPRTAATRRIRLVRHMTALSGFALVRGVIALVLIGAMLMPATALARPTRDGANFFAGTSLPAGTSLGTGLFGFLGAGVASAQPQPSRRPPTRAEREARVASLHLNVEGELQLAPGDRMNLLAMPLDRNGNAIHGLLAKWESSDERIVSVAADGQAEAHAPGTARLTATAGAKREMVRVTVAAGGGASPSGGISTLRAVDEDPLPEEETMSLYDSGNDVGMPVGRTEPGATTPPAAAPGTETPGSANFMLDVPLVGLPGRGIDVRLDLTYNSRLWHKSTNSAGQTVLTYDVDSGSPAPGFQLAYGGYLEWQGANGYTLVEANGTRRRMVQTEPNKYQTTDGTFIRFDDLGEGEEARIGWLYYPDGTRSFYATWIVTTAADMRSYPTKWVDRNGNTVSIYYAHMADQSPFIVAIADSLGRYTRFHHDYNSPKRELLAITVPGYGDSQAADRQVARFYYEDLAIDASFTVATRAPATARVLRYVYFPGTRSGYRYDYSSYGMIYRIVQLREMQVSTTNPDQMGAVTDAGQTAATTEYDYPVGPSNLSDAPQYTRRTDDWAGRTSGSALPSYSFGMNRATGTSTVTAPDGTVTRTKAIVAPGQWNDGLLEEITVERGTSVLSKVRTEWDHDGSFRNQRPKRVYMTDEAGNTRSVEYAIYDVYNNPRSVIERGFGDEVLRRTETTYEERPEWTSRNLIRLPTSVKVFDPAITAPKSRVEYTYDAPEAILVQRGQYDDPAIAHRGNVTKSVRYPDPSDEATKITDEFRYDVFGNVVEATMDCCRKKSYEYDAAYNYAYQTRETRGTSEQLSTRAVYDFNTGLVTEARDENDQATTISYYPENLRPRLTTRADGGTSETTYFDGLTPDPDAVRQHSYVETKTQFEANRYVTARTYMDGRGATARSMTSTPQGWATADVEYDSMGRAYRSSNPYYGTGANDDINPSNHWTTVQYDGLGRVSSTSSPGGTTASITSIEYRGTVVTATDPAGKKRRSIVDALGRMIRLDEPDASGSLGTEDAPTQATLYEHDILDNLTKVTQGQQVRAFAYDGLSRMTHQRQVEADATLDDAGQPIGGGGRWTSFVKYNAQSLVERGVDARGVATTITYDGLNRTKTIDYTDGTPAVTYAYDEARTGAAGAAYYNRGRATSMSTAASGAPATRQEMNYDLMGRVVAHTQQIDATVYTTSYGYDLADQMTRETYPSGRVVSHAYDAAARLAEVRDQTRVYANGMGYAAHGALSGETWGNGAAHTRRYNSRLQLGEIKLMTGTTEVQRYEYQYGVVTNLQTGEVDERRNNGQLGRVIDYAGGQQAREERYTYDALGRLKYATGERRPSPSGNPSRQNYQSHFRYDRYGNRFRPAGDTENVNIDYVPIAAGEISEATNRYTAASSTTPPVAYDAAGNITRDDKFRALSYDYDANNRMRRARSRDGVERGASVYDAAGQRVETRVGDEWHHYVYDASGRVIAEYGPDGWQRDRIYRAGEMIATDESLGETRRTIAQFVDQFYHGVLGRQPTPSESGGWNNRLNNAQFFGAPGLLAAAKELGDELFLSAEYAARNRTDAEFVHDLYWGYLQRPADEGGHQFWVAQVAADGREAVRQTGFAESEEFKALTASLRQSFLVTGAPQWQLTDRLGSVRVVTNEAGAVIGRHDPLPFGDITDEANEAGISPPEQQSAQTTGLPGEGTTGAHNSYNTMRTRFAGMEADAATGLEHTAWRKYDSWQGRWTTADPYTGSMSAGDPQSFNRYAYVGNDPVNFTDPSGLDAVSEGISGAATALGNRTCRALFGGADAVGLLNTYNQNGLIRVGNRFPVGDGRGGIRNERFSGPGTGAVTSPGGTGVIVRPDGSRLSARLITINENGFYFSGRVDGRSVSQIRGEGFQGLNMAQVRAAVIIHELLHAYNRIPEDGPGTPRGTSARNSELVRLMCFSIPNALRNSNAPISTTPTPIGTEITPLPIIGGGGGGGGGFSGGGGLRGDPFAGLRMAEMYFNSLRGSVSVSYTLGGGGGGASTSVLGYTLNAPRANSTR